ncbi:MAG: MYG1 family protein [Verrucomicrobia bacterium]|nr:MYG1 family protein [Verrucomicrobiota bacterium]MDE3047114.1 MYG1 family protein [Verrucomicrobiota bacterium]
MEPRSLGIHDGSFHADEVTACALLLLLDRIDRDKIYRTRDPKVIDRCDYVCDVGGVYDPHKRRFDHHQAEYHGSMSSAGMVLLYLKELGLIEPHLYEYFNKSLVMGVDAHDNGIAKLEPGTTSFSQVITNFLPIEYDVSPEEMDRAFLTAVDFALGHLDRLRKRHSYTLECKATVKKAMIHGSNVLVFDKSLPWLENFFDLGGELHPAQFVIMPSGDHWKLRGIPPTLADRMKVRKPLPEPWAGLHEQELKKISGIEGAVFCHKGRFISIWETKEDALKALHIAMER